MFSINVAVSFAMRIYSNSVHCLPKYHHSLKQKHPLLCKAAAASDNLRCKTLRSSGGQSTGFLFVRLLYVVRIHVCTA